MTLDERRQKILSYGFVMDENNNRNTRVEYYLWPGSAICIRLNKTEYFVNIGTVWNKMDYNSKTNYLYFYNGDECYNEKDFFRAIEQLVLGIKKKIKEIRKTKIDNL